VAVPPKEKFKRYLVHRHRLAGFIEKYVMGMLEEPEEGRYLAGCE
jgi:hypothetical protein